jgi:hypothetical protein
MPPRIPSGAERQASDDTIAHPSGAAPRVSDDSPAPRSWAERAERQASLVSFVFGRWIEEPIGPFYALMIFLLFRHAGQVPDLLVGIRLYSDGSFHGPSEPTQLFVFLVAAAVFASAVWYWAFAANRAEAIIAGGRGELTDTHRSILGSVPYEVAANAAAFIALLSAVLALVSPSLQDDLGVPSWAEVLLLLALSMVVAEGLARGPSVPVTPPPDKQRHCRVAALAEAAPFTSRRSGYAALVLSIAATVAITALPWLNPMAQLVVVALLVTAMMAIVLALLIAIARQAPFLRRRLSTRTLRLAVPIAILIVVLLLASDADRLLAAVRSTPATGLIAMAASIGPLVWILSLLRDACERSIELIANTPRLIKRKRYVPYLHERSALGDSAHIFRRLGRAAGLAIFAGLLLLAPMHWASPNCDGLSYCEPYALRLLPADEGRKRVMARPHISQALKDWGSAHGLTPADDDPRAYLRQVPVVIVAAEGGASRAAAWLLRVVMALEKASQVADGENLFDKHLFAISAVSGGSMGAVTYLQHAAATPPGTPLSDAPWRELATADFLAPSISRYFVTDWLRRFPLVGHVMGNVRDRNSALEDTFARHWTEAGWRGPDATPQDGGLLALQQSRSGLPHLLLNGVDLASGRRILTSTLSLNATGVPPPGKAGCGRAEQRIVPNSIDFFEEICTDVRPATAVMNSARFPLISPAGRYREVLEVTSDEQHVLERQIIDGGYFENYGIETALELSAAIRTASAPIVGFTPVPVLVIISNDASAVDPELAPAVPVGPKYADLTLTCIGNRRLPPEEIEKAREVFDAAPEGLAPVLGIYRIRATHGFEALLDARTELCRTGIGLDPYADTESGRKLALAERDRLFHFGLPKPGHNEHAAPMNWVLHAGVAAFMDAAVDVELNRSQATELAEILEAGGSPSPLSCRC